MRKQGGRLLGLEKGEAIWLDDPNPEGMVRCSGPLSWAPGTIREGGSGGQAGQGVWGLGWIPAEQCCWSRGSSSFLGRWCPVKVGEARHFQGRHEWKEARDPRVGV